MKWARTDQDYLINLDHVVAFGPATKTRDDLPLSRSVYMTDDDANVGRVRDEDVQGLKTS